MPDPQEQNDLPWWFFPATGLNATIAAVWAVDAVACGGLLKGVFSMLITICIYAIVRLDVMVAVLLVFAGSAGAAVALSEWSVFKPRRELLFLLLPLAAFLAGGGLALSGAVPMACSLGPWS